MRRQAPETGYRSGTQAPAVLTETFVEGAEYRQDFFLPKRGSLSVDPVECLPELVRGNDDRIHNKTKKGRQDNLAAFLTRASSLASRRNAVWTRRAVFVLVLIVINICYKIVIYSDDTMANWGAE